MRSIGVLFKNGGLKAAYPTLPARGRDCKRPSLICCRAYPVIIQQLVNGLTLGAVYTLLALSFSLVMGILGILNLAIAELFMIGGYLGFTLITAGFPLPVAVLGGMLGAAVIAIAIEKIGYQPLRDAPL